MAVDIEPLLYKLSELAPRFGRARVDLEAIVSRGRAHDYRGVMQNARLVVEVLLRSLVTDELKQTPGKAMLEELVAKFRQQANSGIIPTKILAHMGTVQAWGNLSAHDHAGSLDDSGVHVGRDEVVASLNSVVAILGWYADKKGLATPAAGDEPTHPRTSSAVGRVIGGRYRLESRLAAGGMGEVYQATHIELGRKLALKLQHRHRAEWVMGAIGGLYGGVSGVWGPPLIVYLLSTGADKVETVRVQGVVFFLGAVVLLGAHLQTGVMAGPNLWFSAALVVPAMVGQLLGQRLQDRLDQARFRRWTQALLVLTGLNLIWRAF